MGGRALTGSHGCVGHVVELHTYMHVQYGGGGGVKRSHMLCVCAVRGTATNHAHTAHAHPQL